jgi:NtrC-family two-component system response regulator AlgB
VSSCEGGTLLLDEIGDLPLPLQPKLLRFLQDREFERVGDPRTRRADVRILAATNMNLGAAVQEGRFREDLFYRLNVIPILIPPLRERPADIIPLAERLLAFFARSNHRAVPGFTDAAKALLTRQSWPGNVRELSNAVERAVILSRSGPIGPEGLGMAGSAGEPATKIGDPVPIDRVEELHIRRVLASSKSLQEAAEVLGIDQATLWRRRKQYGL